MQPQKQQQWKIKIHARSRNFNFKFKSTILPTWKLRRFSILLKLHKFLFQVKSDSEISLKSKILRAFEKIRILRPKKRSFAAKKCVFLRNPEIKSSINRLKRFAYKEPICTGSLVVGILGLFVQSVREKYINGRKMAFLVVAATVFCSLVFYYGQEGYIAGFVWKAWNYVASSGCLSVFSQVISDSLNGS